MLFNSFPFLLLFLPVVLAGFFALGALSRRVAAGWLALSSLFFYGWWDARFVALLAASIVFNFVCGRTLHAQQARRGGGIPRAMLAFAVCANLALLGYFKYTNLLLSTVNAALDAHLPLANIVLPLGISFFTFTQIAFLVDSARGEAREYNFTHYVLFVTYFPHLIAGPILHHREMMPQFEDPVTYRPSCASMALGLSYFSIGLFKKCVIADGFAADVAGVFGPPQQGAAALGVLGAWKGAIAYTLQLYFDFSGYSDMAIGLSRMFSVRLPFNFDSPYRATNIIEFWRRWHMTLSRFLRDYLYYPLGGNRKGQVRRYMNLMVTMLLGGLWHGANWTFLAWGGLHGAYLIINHWWRAARPAPLLESVPVSFRRVGATILTFAAVVVAWVFFRSPDFATAVRVLTAMAGVNGTGTFNSAAAPDSWYWHYIVALCIVFFLPNTQQIIEGARRQAMGADGPFGTVPIKWRPSAVWGAICAAFMAYSMLTFTKVSEFLYFQF